MSDDYRRHDATRWEQWTADGIAIIDTKHNKILVWSYKSAVDGHCMQYSPISSHYYSSDAQKLVFLSKYSHCFSSYKYKRDRYRFFDNIVKQQLSQNVKTKSNRDVCRVNGEPILVPMIIDELCTKTLKIPKSSISYSNIKIIGSYIDKELRYIIYYRNL